MAKKGAIFIKNDLILPTVYPSPHSFQGEKGVGFHLKRKEEGKESSLPN